MRVVPVQPKRVGNIAIALEHAGIKLLLAGYRNLELEAVRISGCVLTGLEIDVDIIAVTQLCAFRPRVVGRHKPSMKVVKVGRSPIWVSMYHDIIRLREGVYEVCGDRVARHRLDDWRQIVAIVIFSSKVVTSNFNGGRFG